MTCQTFSNYFSAALRGDCVLLVYTLFPGCTCFGFLGLYLSLRVYLWKKIPFPVFAVINSFISFPICFTCSAMLHGLYSLLCCYLPQICFALLHELFLTTEQRQDVNPRKQSAESVIKQEQECLWNSPYPKRYSKNWESSVCVYHHTGEANSTGKSQTRLLCLLIKHWKPVYYFCFELWTIKMNSTEMLRVLL